jgi:hypothetical protein
MLLDRNDAHLHQPVGDNCRQTEVLLECIRRCRRADESKGGIKMRISISGYWVWGIATAAIMVIGWLVLPDSMKESVKQAWSILRSK